MKQTILILLTTLFIWSCSPVIKEKNYNHKWVLEVKYIDNTKDTLSGITYSTPGLSDKGVVYNCFAGNLATNVKRIKILKDTIIEI